MTAAMLNRRVTFQAQTSDQDAFGELSSLWTPVYTCWANIDVQRSQLIYATAEFVSKLTHRITFRYTKQIIFTPGMRIVFEDASTHLTHVYEIEALLNEGEKNIWFVAMAYELEAKI